MIVQDIIIMCVQIVFIGALIPALDYGAPKPPRVTSGLTAAGLFVMALTLGSLDLDRSAFFMFLAGILWFVIFGRTPR